MHNFRSRPDRDNYVTINMAYVARGTVYVPTAPLFNTSLHDYLPF